MLDIRIANATVLTMDERVPSATSIGIWGGRIFDVDGHTPARRTVDLDGATVLPGFIDPHVHLVWAGLAEGTPSVAPCTDVDTVLSVIREAAQRRPEGDWVDVVGYDQRPLGRHITAAELDTVSAGRKILLLHDSGHACVVNTPVLRHLGHPGDGFLAEGDMAAARALRQPYAVSDMVDAIERAGRTCRAEGITAASEAGIGGGLISHSPVELAAYQTALDTGRLPLRMRLMVAATLLRDTGAHPTDDIPRAMDLGTRTGFGGDMLSIGAIKVFTDGGMMARTAALTTPYHDEAGGVGQLYAERDVLHSSIVDGHRAGWQLAVHAIGDRALDVAMDAIADAQKRYPRSTRHRIEHAGLVRPDQVDRMAELGLTAVVQPSFLWSFGDDYAAIMGPERAEWLYRGQAFLDAGVALAGSSDRPVTVGAPLRAMQFMVDRLTSMGTVVGPAEGVAVLEALRAYTTSAARACLWEDSMGTITPGKLADLVVLGENPLRSSDLSAIPVLATVVGGEGL